MRRHAGDAFSPHGFPSCRARRLSVCLILPLCLLGGCARDARLVTEKQLLNNGAADLANAEAEIDTAITSLVHRLYGEHMAYAEGRTSEPPSLDILALSGGGDFGAFGAGFLAGWEQVTDADRRPPRFDVVSGVSTGALLAPFAFLGTREDIAAVESFYRNPKKDWIRLRDWFFFLPGRVSLMLITGLERDLRAAVNEDFVRRLAAESSAGRLLVITATNLDFGRGRHWDLAHEAARALESNDLDRVQRRMLASAAIPGAFPPVEIDGLLFGDGGIVANIFVPLDWKTPNRLLPTWKRMHPDIPFPPTRCWIIVNNQMNQIPQTVQATWLDTAGVGIAASIRASNELHIELAAARADYLNAAQGTRMEVRVVAIPDEWRPPVEGNFERDTMNSLADIGRKLGAAGDSWTLRTQPLKEPDTAPPTSGRPSP